MRDRLVRFFRQHWPALAIIVASLILFSPALTNFFSGDDWFHLDVSRISSFSEFLNFFSFGRNSQSIAFYRPLSTQVFFFIFYRLFGLSALPYHLFIFALYGLSLWLFYWLALKLKFPRSTALIALFLYAFSQTHFTRLNFISASQEIFLAIFFLIILILQLRFAHSSEITQNPIKTKTENSSVAPTSKIKKSSPPTFWEKTKSVLSSLVSSLKNQDARSTKQAVITSLLFIGALLCKETAVIIPLAVFIIDLFPFHGLRAKLTQLNTLKYGLLISITIIYLGLRFFVFGLDSTADSTYRLSFSPKATVNSLYTYGLWSLGGAEFLQDYMDSPLSLIPRFYTDHGLQGRAMIWMLMLAAVVSIFAALLIFITKPRIRRSLLAYLALFVICLLPVLFFPQHKFALFLTLPMMWLAIFFGLVLNQFKRIVVVVSLVLFFVLNLNSMLLTQKTHYSIQRSLISSRVYQLLRTYYPTLNSPTTFMINNSVHQGSDLETWGSSRQIYYALWGDHFFHVFYADSPVTSTEIQVFYEDLMDDNTQQTPTFSPQIVVLPASFFI